MPFYFIQVGSCFFPHSQDVTDLSAIISEQLSFRGPLETLREKHLGVEGDYCTQVVNSANDGTSLQSPAMTATTSCERHRENLKDQQVQLKRRTRGPPSNHPKGA